MNKHVMEVYSQTVEYIAVLEKEIAFVSQTRRVHKTPTDRWAPGFVGAGDARQSVKYAQMQKALTTKIALRDRLRSEYKFLTRA